MPRLWQQKIQPENPKAATLPRGEISTSQHQCKYESMYMRHICMNQPAYTGLYNHVYINKCPYRSWIG